MWGGVVGGLVVLALCVAAEWGGGSRLAMGPHTTVTTSAPPATVAGQVANSRACAVDGTHFENEEADLKFSDDGCGPPGASRGRRS